MNKALVGAVLIALVIGLGAGYGLGYVIYQPQLQSIQDDIDDMTGDMNAVEGDVTSLQDQMGSYNSEIAGIQSQLTLMSNKILELNSTLLALQDQLPHLQSQIALLPPLQSQVASLQSQLSSLNTKLDDLQAQIAELKATKMGILSIPASEFVPNDGSNLSDTIQLGVRWASVQLPNEVTVTNMTAYLLDQPHEFNPWIEVDLLRYDLNDSSLEIMAHVETDPVGGSWEWQTYYDDTIDYAQIDNRNYIYGLKTFVGGASGNGWRLRAVVIEYEYLL